MTRRELDQPFVPAPPFTQLLLGIVTLVVVAAAILAVAL